MENYKVTFSTIGDFENLRTIIVNYLILPVVSLVMFLLIIYGTEQDFRRVLIGSLVTTAIITMIGIITGSYCYDQNVVTSEEIISIKPKFSQYWLPKIVIASVAAALELLILALIALTSMGMLAYAGKLASGFLIMIVFASLLAYICALAGDQRENPYWLTNIATASLVLVAGVIIPVSQYPTWLRVVAEVFPVSDLLDWILAGSYFNQALAVALFKLGLWFILAGGMRLYHNWYVRNR